MLVAVLTTIAAVVAPIVVTAAGDDDRASAPTTTLDKPAGPTTSVDPSALDPDGLVPAARDGYAAFIGDYDEYVDGGFQELRVADCPWITPAELVAAVAPIGDAASLEPAIEATLEIDVPDPDDDATGSVPQAPIVTITCDTMDVDVDDAGASPGSIYGVGFAVFDLGADPDEMEGLAEFVAEGGVVVTAPSSASLGGTMYGYCEEDFVGEEPTVPVGCYQLWVYDAFIVGIYVDVHPDVGEQVLPQLADVLLGQLPVTLQRIADGIPHVEVLGDIEDDPVVTVVPCGETAAPQCLPPTTPTAGFDRRDLQGTGCGSTARRCRAVSPATACR